MTGKQGRPRKIRFPLRPCLKCREEFESEWIGNRLCLKCRNIAALRSWLVKEAGRGKHVDA
jgi:hypothetical protein